MEVISNSFMPGDPRLVQQLVNELKSQGIFDQFRKECFADVDTKPAYQNLRQRVEGSVAAFLKEQKWSPDMNKNQVREQLKKNIYESNYLETGVERIVDQVVNPKINTVFLPIVEDVVYKYLGIEKRQDLTNNVVTTDLLPKDLEAVSPESEHSTKHHDQKDNSDTLNDSLNSKIEDDESPPFEPLENAQQAVVLQDETSLDSELSGMSGLQSHESILVSESKSSQMDWSWQDTQLSQNSSESKISAVTFEDQKTNPNKHFAFLKNVDADNIISSTNKMDDDTSKTENSVESMVIEEDESTFDSQKQNKDDAILDVEEKTKVFKEDVKNKEKEHREKKSSETRRDEKKRNDDKKSKSSSKHSSKDDKYRKNSSGKEKEKSSSRHSSSSKDRSTKDKDKIKDEVKTVKDKDSKTNRDLDKDRHDKEKGKEKDKHSKTREKDDEKLSKQKYDKDKSKSKKESDKHDADKSKIDKEKSSKEKSERSKDRSKDRVEKSKSDKSKDKARKTDEKSDKKDKDKNKSSGNNNDKSVATKELSSLPNSKKSESSKDSKSSDKHKSEKYPREKNSDDSKDKKRDSKKDDHYSLKERKNQRRSFDRDSNDGHSGKNTNSLKSDSKMSESQTTTKESSSTSFSGSGDSGNSDSNEIVNDNTDNVIPQNEIQLDIEVPKMKYIKPKFALNFAEAKRIMKIRRQLAILERQNQLSLADLNIVPNGLEGDENKSKAEGENENKTSVDETPKHSPFRGFSKDAETPPQKSNVEEKDKISNLNLQSIFLSKENWEALETRLEQEMLKINFNAYESHYDDYDDDNECCSIVVSPEMNNPTENTCVIEEIVPSKISNHENKIVSAAMIDLENKSSQDIKDDDNEMSHEIVEEMYDDSVYEETVEFDNQVEELDNSDVEREEIIEEIVDDDEMNIIIDLDNRNCTKEETKNNHIYGARNLSVNLQHITVQQKRLEFADDSIEGSDGSVDDEESITYCTHFKKPHDVMSNLAVLHKIIDKLEKDLEYSIKEYHNNILPEEGIKIVKRGRKRKFDENVDIKNNNQLNYQKISGIKKRGRPPGSKRSLYKPTLDKSCTATVILANDNFSMPLSPAESDNSIEKKEEYPVLHFKNMSIPKATTPRMQRYTSDDLYKPRPIVTSTRRSKRDKNP